MNSLQDNAELHFGTMPKTRSAKLRDFRAGQEILAARLRASERLQRIADRKISRGLQTAPLR